MLTVVLNTAKFCHSQTKQFQNNPVLVVGCPELRLHFALKVNWLDTFGLAGQTGWEEVGLAACPPWPLVVQPVCVPVLASGTVTVSPSHHSSSRGDGHGHATWTRGGERSFHQWVEGVGEGEGVKRVEVGCQGILEGCG